jgi:hypothetical protein
MITIIDSLTMGGDLCLWQHFGEIWQKQSHLSEENVFAFLRDTDPEQTLTVQNGYLPMSEIPEGVQIWRSAAR